MGLQIEQCADLLYATLQKFEKDQFQIALKHQTAEVVNRWFKKDKMVLDGGDQVNFYIQLKNSNNASHTRLYDVDNVNVANVISEGTVKWTHAKTAWAFDIRSIAMNKGNATRVFNLLESRVKAAYHDMVNLLEEAAWRTPSASTDDLNPHGIAAWLVQADTDGETGDFTGYVGDYTTADDSELAYTTVGGIECSATTNPRWANWYADHNNQLDHSLLKLLRRAFRKTKFQTPTLANKALDPESSFYNFRLYTSDAVLGALEELAIMSDDRVGNDLGKYAGGVVFKGIPFIYVDDLDTELTYVRGADPIYGVNHAHFKPIVLRDNNFRISKPKPKSNSHNVLEGFVDLSYAYVCDNRRAAGFLISDWEGQN